jgi:hypothetical protein
MANTYELITSQTVGSGGASSVTFSSIPATYTDLLIKGSARDSGTGSVYMGIRLDLQGSNTGFSQKMLYGDGSSAASASDSGHAWQYGDSASATANTFGNWECYIPNYLAAQYKSYNSDSVAENNGTPTITAMTAGLWSNTTAISTITLTTAGSGFVQYSSFYLYGIKNS